MIRDITIGQYYAENSVIHKLDSRVKIICTLLFIISLFLVKSIFLYPIIVLLLGVVVKTSRVPPLFIFRGLKSIVIIIFFTVVINVFMTPGDTILAQIGSVRITLEGVIVAGLMALRLVLLIVGSSLLTLTTTPIELTDGIESLLNPFKKVGVPAHDIAMMMSIALRFIPTLLEETDKIIKAQQARGADFETGGLVKKAKSLVPILVPLFISAFRRADELAIAMEARCYNGDHNRTKMKQMKFERIDLYACMLFGCYVMLLIGVRFFV